MYTSKCKIEFRFVEMSKERSVGLCSQWTASLFSILSCLFTALFGTSMVMLGARDVLELLKRQGEEDIKTKRI